MKSDTPASDATATQNDVSLPALAGLGPALRRAWVGYQLRLDASMAAAGFEERRFPDGRMLRLCSGQGGSTISAIGRELEITRQGASKLVRLLCDRGYVSVTESETSKREKTVVLTPRGRDYLQSLRREAQVIEDELRIELGDAAFAGLVALLDALGDADQPRLRAYLGRSAPTS